MPAAKQELLYESDKKCGLLRNNHHKNAARIVQMRDSPHRAREWIRMGRVALRGAADFPIGGINVASFFDEPFVHHSPTGSLIVSNSSQDHPRRRAIDLNRRGAPRKCGGAIISPCVFHALLAAASLQIIAPPHSSAALRPLQVRRAPHAPVAGPPMPRGWSRGTSRRRPMAAIGFVNGTIDTGFVGQLKTLSIRAAIETPDQPQQERRRSARLSGVFRRRRDRRGLDPRRAGFGRTLCVAEPRRSRVRAAPPLCEPRPRRRAGWRGRLRPHLEPRRLRRASTPRRFRGAGLWRALPLNFRWAGGHRA